MNTDENDILKKGIIRIWIIWGAMFCSLFIYVVICHVLKLTWQPLAGSDFPIDRFKNGLYFSSFVILLLSHYVRNFIIKADSETQLARFFRVAAQANIPIKLFKYQTAVIISLALSESVGLFGFVVFILTKEFYTLYIFIAISAAAMLYHIPKMSEI